MINIRKELLILKDEKYKEFQGKLLPGINSFIGVRVPVIRKLSKKISKDDQIDYINNYKCEYLEEYLLKGLFISNINDIKLVLIYLDDFVPLIDNWEVCDIFVSALKIIKENKDRFFKYIQKYINSDKEYEKRFALVVLLNYYVEDNYISDIINIIKNIKCNYYYDKMALAWLISVCYIDYKNEINIIMNILDKDVYNMTIRKIKDSRKITNCLV